MSLTHPKYRPDIDGLRALAVLSVVLFHTFPKLMRGGFIGVDIFFVISGFLISTIIFQSLARGEFSFLDFYARRVRRIFPALITIMLTSFIAGWFILFPDEYKQFGQHMMGGALFVSNLVLYKESGYFDTAAEIKPLLHLWSLGIEEQFYIIFPLVAWLAWRARLNMLSFVTLAGVVSFALNVSHIEANQVWSFYQPQARAWELMMGAMLAIFVTDTSGWMNKVGSKMDLYVARLIYRRDVALEPGLALANFKSWLGLALIVYGLSTISKDTHFPGKWALLPTVGAALLIWGGPQAFVNKSLLSNRVAVWFGKISYPLYLWHWPILVFLRISMGDTPIWFLRVGVIVTSIVLSWLTYRFIEKPIRFDRSASQPQSLVLVA